MSKYIERLEKNEQFWREKAMMVACEKNTLEGKIDIYEKIISKLFEDNEHHTDDVIFFDGKVYRPVGFNLNHNVGEQDTLTVECVGLIGPFGKGEGK